MDGFFADVGGMPAKLDDLAPSDENEGLLIPHTDEAAAEDLAEAKAAEETAAAAKAAEEAAAAKAAEEATAHLVAPAVTGGWRAGRRDR